MMSTIFNYDRGQVVYCNAKLTLLVSKLINKIHFVFSGQL